MQACHLGAYRTPRARARGIGRGPKPLRSLMHPWGLPDLPADD